MRPKRRSRDRRRNDPRRIALGKGESPALWEIAPAPHLFRVELSWGPCLAVFRYYNVLSCQDDRESRKRTRL